MLTYQAQIGRFWSSSGVPWLVCQTSFSEPQEGSVPERGQRKSLQAMTDASPVPNAITTAAAREAQ